MTTKEQIAQLRASIAEVADRAPAAVLLAMLDELVETACGTNPALKDWNRMMFYRNLFRRLKAGGLA